MVPGQSPRWRSRCRMCSSNDTHLNLTLFLSNFLFPCSSLVELNKTRKKKWISFMLLGSRRTCGRENFSILLWNGQIFESDSWTWGYLFIICSFIHPHLFIFKYFCNIQDTGGMKTKMQNMNSTLKVEKTRNKPQV